VALAATAALYALTINNHWAIERDSAAYLSLGQSVAEGRGMTFNGQSMWSLPPMVPFLIAGCRLIVGPDLWLINLVIKLFAVGAIAMTYLVVRRLATDLPEHIREGLAFGAILIVGTSARLLRETAPILTDVVFLFWVTLALYLFLRGREGHWAWCLAGGLVMLAACATRYVGVVLYGGMALALAMDLRRPGGVRRLAAGLAGFDAMALGGLLAYGLFFKAQPAGGLLATLAAAPLEQWNTLVGGDKWVPLGGALVAVPTAFFETLVDQGITGLGLAAFAVIAAGWVAAWRRREWLVTVPLALYLAFLVALGQGAVAPRYLLAFLPVLAYLLLRGTYSAAIWARSYWQRRKTPAAPAEDGSRSRTEQVALIAVVVLVMGISLPKDVRQIYWMRHEPFYEVYEKGRWQRWVDLCAYLRAHGRPGMDVVGTAETAVVSYLSGLPIRTELFQVDPRPNSLRYTLASPSTFPAEVLGRLVAKSDIRFLVVPLHVTATGAKLVGAAPGEMGEWSEQAVRSLEATGVFLTPPQRFGDLALYERRP